MKATVFSLDVCYFFYFTPHFLILVLNLTQAAGVATGGAVMLTGATHSMELELHVTDYPFDHKGPMSAFDAGSIRRGHEVYKNICATCHSLERIAYRNLVGVCYTEAEVINGFLVSLL